MNAILLDLCNVCCIIYSHIIKIMFKSFSTSNIAVLLNINYIIKNGILIYANYRDICKPV